MRLLLAVVLCFAIMFSFTTAFQRLPNASPRVGSLAQRMMASERTYTGYNIYKGKAALNIKPIPPSFSKSGKSGRTVSREGSLLLEFAPVGSNPREYNWNQKVTFSLSVSECGEILAMDRTKALEFLHDPNMGGKSLPCL